MSISGLFTCVGEWHHAQHRVYHKHLLKRTRSDNNVDELVRDDGLPCPVVLYGESIADGIGILACIFHGHAFGRHFRGMAFCKRPVQSTQTIKLDECVECLWAVLVGH